MRNFVWIAFGVSLFLQQGFSQPVGAEAPAADVSGPADPSADTPAGSGANTVATTPEFVPMTTSERARLYLKSAFGPGAIVRAAASGGIGQSSGTPKEWGGGAEAYGERVGNALAKHVIREALEFGASSALHEDNRYVRSTDSGFFKRTKHAVGSIFVARNEAGGEHFAYSRFGSVLGSSFISRIWLPRSMDTAGDAASSFGLTMISDIGFNVFHEFCPRSLTRKFRVH